MATPSADRGRPAGLTVRRLVTLGDSFTAGTPEIETPWPEHAAAALGCEVTNLALFGARSAEVQAGQVGRAVALSPDVVSLICGANDVLLTTRPDVAAFTATYAGMLARLRTELPDAVLVVATYPHPDARSPLRPRSLARVRRGLREVNDGIRWLARRHGAVCLELDGHPDAAGANVAADGFHPSQAGHRRLAVAFVERLREHLDIGPEEDLE